LDKYEPIIPNIFHQAIGHPTSIVNQKRLAVAHALMQVNAWLT